MKNKKRIITIILSLTIPVMLLSGCGGEGKDNTSSSAKASSNNSSQGAGAYQSDAVKEALSVVTLGEYKGVSVSGDAKCNGVWATDGISGGSSVSLSNYTGGNGGPGGGGPGGPGGGRPGGW